MEQSMYRATTHRRAAWALALLSASGALSNTSSAATIVGGITLPDASETVLVPGGNLDTPGTLSETGPAQSATATLDQSGVSAQVTNSGEAEAVANFYLVVSGPTPTVQLTLSNALLSTSGVVPNPNYGADYQIAANLSISQTPDFLGYTGVVSGSLGGIGSIGFSGTPVANGVLNLNGTYTFNTGEPIYIQEQALAEYTDNGVNAVWSASVDPVFSVSSSVANPSAYTFTYSAGAPVVPLPSSIWLMVSGLVGFGLFGRRLTAG
jgi:hypothetical protein